MPGLALSAAGFASYDAAKAGRVLLHTRIDERTAGFLALGIAKTSGRPAVVFCTSGTAAANLHPAVLEAAHSGVPLVVVTADRPASLRGTGANQTTDQVGLYGDAAPCFDISGPVPVPRPLSGPLHLNVQFVEPLTPSDQAPQLEWPPHPVGARQVPSEGVLSIGPRTVVVAGDDAGPPARILAQDAHWPLFAEPSSGSRTGNHPIRSYRLLLESELGQAIERVIVFGHPTLSRPVSALLSRPNLEVVSVRPRGRWTERPHPVVATYDQVSVAGRDESDWFSRWQALDRSVCAELDALTDEELGPHAVAREVSLSVPPGGLLYLGASNPIRDLDLMAYSPTPGQRRKVLANRGLAGIDGTLSSAIGAALTRRGRNLLLLGDVTFMHDLTGLVIGPHEERPDLTIVVVNDDGGSIFASLEQGSPQFAESFDRIFATPHGVDFSALCAALKVPHWRVTSREELRHALASPHGGIEVVEVVVRRDNRREVDEVIRELGKSHK
ncbi:MAG: thiamine pyrophosphate-binding protein [Marmoricola sp.]